MPAVAELTPMLRHYLELKGRYPGAFLFYRLGDFYELFFEDAERGAPLLELTLTARQRGTESEAPMCGVPHHAIDTYVGKLIRLGHKAVICDQVEDPSAAKGLVRREVTRVITPGTLSEPGLLESREENWLATLVWEGSAGAGVFLDVSTGRFFLRRWSDASEALADLETLHPRELLASEEDLPPRIRSWAARDVPCRTPLDDRWLLSASAAASHVARHFGVATLRGFGLSESEPGVRAAAAALLYARASQQNDLTHVRGLEIQETSAVLVLDGTTLANLEVFRNARDGGRSATLLSAVDRTATPGGARVLREWLRRPLRDRERIRDRHEAIAELLADGGRLDRLRAALAHVPDFDRLASRAVLGSLGPREAGALRDGLTAVPRLLSELSGAANGILARVAGVDPLSALAERLRRTLVEVPPATLDAGGVVAPGVDPELDEIRSLSRDAKGHVQAMEERERKRTGIGSLKIRFNRVFGYSIEVTHANQSLVPPDYERRQTLTHAERYATPELKALEEKILHAEERMIVLERARFEELRVVVTAESRGLAELAGALSELDVLAGWAELAATERFVAPSMGEPGSGIRIEAGRHPVVERVLAEAFVPNDVLLDPAQAQIVVLTGPNMGGKSTYLRQVALLVVLAQAGCFVPANAATIGVVDRIFSRVGASDDLARGESTFMVEMIETSNILRFATAGSLVILDEVGRGTATFDGLSLAWAIVEHLHERVGALTLFATHYHELTDLAALLPRVVNRTMAVKEWGDKIHFLRRVVPGAADKSYGLHVARLAGIPGEVLERAAQVLANLEANEFDPAGRPRLAEGAIPAGSKAAQMPLFIPAEEIVAKVLREVDVDQLAPLAALNLVASLKDRLK